MPAPIGNRFWEARSSHGRYPKFENPEELWEACCEYFEWNESNPLWEVKSYQYQGAPVQDQVPKMRAMTKEGLYSFLDISKNCWADYKKIKDFTPICQKVEEIIYRQKFEGAAADFLNANIIARDLGLKEQSASEVNGHISVSDLTDDELARRIRQFDPTAED